MVYPSRHIEKFYRGVGELNMIVIKQTLQDPALAIGPGYGALNASELCIRAVTRGHYIPNPEDHVGYGYIHNTGTCRESSVGG